MTTRKEDILLLKALMKETGWEALLRLLADQIDAINADKIGGSNEFDTLKQLHTNQGKVVGLTEFFDRLERKAFE